MSRSRRFLPSVSLLAAFEAVLRSGSTASAARDLDLTQGAVSRLVQNLEAQLGQTLFVRERRRLIPTEAARSYGRDISRALDLIARASLEVAANPGGGTFSLSILPAFGASWLVPRLPGFMAAHPEVSINLATRLKRFNFAAEGFDAAIHFGSNDWRGAGHLRLCDETLVPCASPEFLRRHPISEPRDLLGLPLLQIETRPEAWTDWFTRNGVAASLPRGMLFDQFAPMTQSALHGMGVALLPKFMIETELAEGNLLPVWGEPVHGSGAYWLVWPEARADYPPLVAFREWIAGETASLRKG